MKALLLDHEVSGNTHTIGTHWVFSCGETVQNHSLIGEGHMIPTTQGSCEQQGRITDVF